MRIPETKIDAATERLMAEALERRAHALSRRQRAVEVVLSALTISLALALALFAEADRSFSLPLAVAFVVAYGVVARVGFNLGDGYVVPTQLVFIPMLLLLPTPVVPLLVIAGVLVARSVDVVRGVSAPQRLLLAFGDAAFALVPAAVLVALDAQLPEWAAWPAYAVALGAQFAVDTVRDTAIARLTGGAPTRVVLRELAQSHRVDALLAPIGLLAAIAAAGAPAAALLVLPLVSLLAVFARERDARIAHSIELGRAYRGTALLLCDMLEEDDEYTGHHTQDVVELSVRVAERMGVERGRAARVRARGDAARHREDLDPRRDHQQAGAARRRRVGADEDAHGRGPAHARPRRRPARERRPRRARLARALRRRRLPGRPRGRGDPARLAHRFRLRRLQRDDHDPLLPQGDARRGRGGRAPPLLGHAVRSGRGHGARRARGRVA